MNKEKTTEYKTRRNVQWSFMSIEHSCCRLFSFSFLCVDESDGWSGQRIPDLQRPDIQFDDEVISSS